MSHPSLARSAFAALAVSLGVSSLVGCAGPVETAPVSAPVVAPVAERPAAPMDFVVTAEGDKLVARWAAPVGSDSVTMLQYELYINTAPAITLEADATTYELPGVTVESGAFVQLRAVGEAGPGKTAEATVERQWPADVPVQQAMPTPVPAPVVVVPAEPPLVQSTPAPVAPAAVAPAPVAPAPAVAPPTQAPAPVATAVPAPAAPDQSVTVEGTLRTSWVWSSGDVDEPFCQTMNLSLIAYNGADEVDAIATIEETEPADLQVDEYTISWLCNHRYSFTVTGDSPGYKIVAENQSSDKVEPWERFYATEALASTEVSPYLSYCSGCSP